MKTSIFSEQEKQQIKSHVTILLSCPPEQRYYMGKFNCYRYAMIKAKKVNNWDELKML